jgi:hypothetical protein
MMGYVQKCFEDDRVSLGKRIHEITVDIALFVVSRCANLHLVMTMMIMRMSRCRRDHRYHSIRHLSWYLQGKFNPVGVR